MEAKFNIGDIVVDDCAPSWTYEVASAPDALGNIALLRKSVPPQWGGLLGGVLTVRQQGSLKLAPKRYVVELRRPKVGERYTYRGEFIRCSDDHDEERFVIVEELRP